MSAVKPESLAERLAERLAGYAICPILQDHPHIQRDLIEASEWLTAHAALLDAWGAVFAELPDEPDPSGIDRLKPQLKEQFAELLGTAPGMLGWKRRLELKVVLTDETDGVSPQPGE